MKWRGKNTDQFQAIHKYVFLMILFFKSLEVIGCFEESLKSDFIGTEVPFTIQVLKS